MSRKIFLSLALASSFVLATEAEDHLHKAQEAIIGKKLPKDTSSPSKEEMMLKNIDETLQRIKDKQRFDKAEWDNQIKKTYDDFLEYTRKRDKKNKARGFTTYPKNPDTKNQYNQVFANKSSYCNVYESLKDQYGTNVQLDSNPQKDEIKAYQKNVKSLCAQYTKKLDAFYEQIEDEKIADKK